MDADVRRGGRYLGKKALPLMARHVFIEVLQALGVKVAFADGEADKVVAAMAKMHGDADRDQI